MLRTVVIVRTDYYYKKKWTHHERTDSKEGSEYDENEREEEKINMINIRELQQ